MLKQKNCLNFPFWGSVGVATGGHWKKVSCWSRLFPGHKKLVSRKNLTSMPVLYAFFSSPLTFYIN